MRTVVTYTNGLRRKLECARVPVATILRRLPPCRRQHAAELLNQLVTLAQGAIGAKAATPLAEVLSPVRGARASPRVPRRTYGRANRRGTGLS